MADGARQPSVARLLTKCLPRTHLWGSVRALRAKSETQVAQPLASRLSKVAARVSAMFRWVAQA
jgi:hypothetical protein